MFLSPLFYLPLLSEHISIYAYEEREKCLSIITIFFRRNMSLAHYPYAHACLPPAPKRDVAKTGSISSQPGQIISFRSHSSPPHTQTSLKMLAQGCDVQFLTVAANIFFGLQLCSSIHNSAVAILGCTLPQQQHSRRPLPSFLLNSETKSVII